MNNDLHPAVGKYCIVRCTYAGVHAGAVFEVAPDRVTLNDSRRLWYWKAKQGISLSAAALYGIDAKESRVPAALPALHLSPQDVCKFIEASIDARQTIEDAPDAEARG